MEKRTLYISDLDGTLLRSNQRTSEYTNHVIHSLSEKGMVFSYATARSIITASTVTEGLEAKIPVITYNGSFIVDNQTHEMIDSSFLDADIYLVLKELFSGGIYPLVYAIIDGKERYSNYPAKSSKGTLDFVTSRNDVRKRLVDSEEELIQGNIFYIICIEAPEKIKPFYEKYKNKYHCVYQTDIYSGEQWLEIMPKNATKASAIQRLKEITGCNYVVAFGDGVNDIEMFECADECYAMANAVLELKKIATKVIDSNDNDGVAHWLDENVLSRDQMVNV